jgi:16S rRNA (guanine527-N7)-methyltransferase
MSRPSLNVQAAGRREQAAAERALRGFNVPPDAMRDLLRFVELLREWQRAHNLVAASTLQHIWVRHVADSLQLLEHAPQDFQTWFDLGSGAGFPGLVVAIACKHNRRAQFTLVESNRKKAAFLRAVIRETGAAGEVATERIETLGARMRGRADIISARALAALPLLLEWSAPYARNDTVLLLPKGQDVVHELEAAAKSWDFDVVSFASATDPGGRILAIRRLRARVRP